MAWPVLTTHLTVSNQKTTHCVLRQQHSSNSSCISMLSPQTSNLLPGRHQRQNSTPTVFNTPKILLPATQRQYVPHRRGLSIDQPIPSNQRQDRHFQQDEIMTEDEYFNRQQLIQALMREVQQQNIAVRPGHGKVELLTGSAHQQQPPTNIQQAPCPEHGTGFVTNDQPNIQFTAWENNNTQQQSLQDSSTASEQDTTNIKGTSYLMR